MHKKPNPLLLGASAATLLFASGMVIASDTDDLKAENKALNERLTQIENQLKQQPPSAASASGFGASQKDINGIPGHSILSLTDSTVWLYGAIDATIGSYNGIPNGTGGHKWQTGSLVGALGLGKWGILAEHVLDSKSGLKIMANLEGEFETPTGNEDTPGTIFNRQAWVGFKSDDLGQLIFGRNDPVAKNFDGIWADPFHDSSEVTYGATGYTNNDNFKYPVWYIGVATGTHADSNVQYKKVMGPWVLGLDYQFGGSQRRGDVASGFGSSFSENSGQQVALAYNGNDYHIAGHISHVNRAGQIDKAFTIGGNYRFNPLFEANAGYLHYNADQAAIGSRTDNAVTLSGKFTPPGRMSYEFGAINVKFNNAAAGADGAVLIPFLQDASNGAANIANGRGGSGSMQTIFGGTRYHWDNRTQLYLIVDHMTVKNGVKINGFYDGQFGGKSNPSAQTEILAGINYKF